MFTYVLTSLVYCVCVNLFMMDLSSHQIKKLKQLYKSAKKLSAYGRELRLYKEAEKFGITRKQVSNYLKTEDCYTKHRRTVGKFTRRKFMSPGLNYLWQADLIVLPKLGKANKGNKYILTVIDVFSKYAWATPIKTKSSESVINAFKQIFMKVKPPKYLQCDEGKEFFNRMFLNFLKKKQTILYHSFSEKKACVAERFNRTLMTRLMKYFEDANTKTYIDVIGSLLQSYNSSFHRTIQMAPKDVTAFNEMDIWMYAYKDLFSKKKEANDLHVNDLVRIKVQKKTFEKGYTKTYSDQLFVIKEVISSIPITYKVSSYSGEEILGAFYRAELSSVK